MSYPTELQKFRAWAKAMELGATVGKPHYPGTSQPPHKPRRKRRRKRRRSLRGLRKKAMRD